MASADDVPLQDILAQLQKLRLEYDKAQETVAEQDTLINFLRDTSSKKDAMISKLEEELREKQVTFNHERDLLEEEHQTELNNEKHHSKLLDMKIDSLERENALAKKYEREASELREKVYALQLQLRRQQEYFESDANEVRDDFNRYRTALEREFRDQLVVSKEKFRALAFKEVDSDSKAALIENQRLGQELLDQNEKIEQFLRRMRGLEVKHKKVVVEHSLQKDELDAHRKQVKKLKKQLTDLQKAKQGLEETNRHMKVDTKSVEALYEELERSRRDIHTLKEKLSAVAEAKEKWKGKAEKWKRECEERVHAPTLSRMDKHNEGSEANIHLSDKDESLSLADTAITRSSILDQVQKASHRSQVYRRVLEGDDSSTGTGTSAALVDSDVLMAADAWTANSQSTLTEAGFGSGRKKREKENDVQAIWSASMGKETEKEFLQTVMAKPTASASEPVLGGGRPDLGSVAPRVRKSTGKPISSVVEEKNMAMSVLTRKTVRPRGAGAPSAHNAPRENRTTKAASKFFRP